MVIRFFTWAFVVCYLFSHGCIAAQETEADITQCPNPPHQESAFVVNIGSYHHAYPIVTPQGNLGIKIVYIPDFNDNFEMGDEATSSLKDKLREAKLLDDIEAVALPGDKANMLGTLLYQKIRTYKEESHLSVPQFCIIRSTEKGTPLKSITYSSITGGNKMLHLREDHYERLKNKKVLVVDDVIATGGTLKALKDLLEEECHCHVIGYACVAVEGENRDHFEDKPLISLINLPIFKQSVSEGY